MGTEGGGVEGAVSLCGGQVETGSEAVQGSCPGGGQRAGEGPSPSTWIALGAGLVMGQ